MARKADTRHTLAQLARLSRGRLISVLTGSLGARHLELIEDAVSEAVLQALSQWPYDGVPDEPVAWLQTVARRRAIDSLRRRVKEVDLAALAEPRVEGVAEDADEGDPELELAALCCHPSLAPVDQLALALRVVSGFTAREIATLFLTTETAMAARLTRARKTLVRTGRAAVLQSVPQPLEQRSEELRRFCYLLFALGYAPQFGDTVVRHDVAAEALRLTRLLARHVETRSPASSALAALVCFQASRLPARSNPDGEPIRLRDSDRTQWDRRLIAEGLAWLDASAEGPAITRYHLEAAIASAYATAPSLQDVNWDLVLGSYADLRRLTDSPVVRLNEAIARMESDDVAGAADALAALADVPELSRYGPYHLACSELAERQGDSRRAARCLQRSLDCPASTAVAAHLANRLSALG